ncbi:MAG: efflux RND transporter periplasmic adaptor subunit, partial [Methyloceanibacter sp.]
HDPGVRSMRRIVTILFPLLVWGVPALAGPGPDHDHEPAQAPADHGPRLESVGTELELVATVEGHKLVIHLDRFDTNEPVDGASIEVSGEDVPPAIAKPLGNGVYEIEAGWADAPGTKALTFVVTTGGAADLLNGTLNIPSSAAASEPAITWSSVLARPETWIVVALGMAFGFFLAFAFRPIRLPDEDQAERPLKPGAQPRLNVVESKRQAVQIIWVAASLLALATTTSLAHEDHADQSPPPAAGGNTPRKLADGEVFLPKPSQRLLHIRTLVTRETSARPGTELVGTVVADPSFEGRVQAPMDGVIELAGEGVSFVGQSVKAGDVLAKLAPSMPVYERGALEQMAADVDGKLRIAEARLQRLTGVTEGYVTQREIEDTKTEIESLQEQKRVLEPKSAEKWLLRAPVSGIISVANVRAGQVVTARDTLFEIVDPARLWVEAIGAGGLDDYTSIEEALALGGKGEIIALTYVGQAPSLRQHSRPLFFKVDEPRQTLAIGTTVKVILHSGAPQEGIVLPEGAVVRGPNGLPQVWTKVGPERFKPLPVRTVALDGAKVLVTAGLAAGDRVVVDGSELINQVR